MHTHTHAHTSIKFKGKFNEHKMKRFKTINAETQKKPHYCGFVVFTYIIQMCVCVRTWARTCVRVFVCFCFYMNKLYVYKLLTPTKYTAHTQYSVLCFMSAHSTISRYRQCGVYNIHHAARARVTNNLDEKISQVGIFSLMGNSYYLFLRIFGIWWAHITGNHHMSLENADKAEMCLLVCVHVCVHVPMRRVLFENPRNARTHTCKRFYTHTKHISWIYAFCKLLHECPRNT